MATLSVSDEFTVISAVDAISHILQLDDLWTRGLQYEPGPRDSAVLIEVGERISDCLLGLQGMADGLRRVLDVDADVRTAVYIVNPGMTRAGSAGDVMPTWGRQAWERVLYELPGERKHLNDKVALLREGQWTAGDLSDGFVVVLGTVLAVLIRLLPQQYRETATDCEPVVLLGITRLLKGWFPDDPSGGAS